MATIGEQLLQPEEGWVRYDDTHEFLIYDGDWSDNGQTSAYGQSVKRLNSAKTSDKLMFEIYGTGIRILCGHSNVASISKDNKITVDGIDYSFTTYRGGNTLCSILSFELMLDTDGKHYIEIQPQEGKLFMFDCIDVFGGHLCNKAHNHSFVSYDKATIEHTLPMNTTQAILAKMGDLREGLLGMANDPENYGDLYVVGKDGRSHLTKSGIKSEVIFEGSARGKGDFNLSKPIEGFKLLLVNCSSSWSSYVDTFREEIVVDVAKLKYVPYEHIYNTTLSSTQRSMCFNFNKDSATFTISDYIIGNLTYMEINKIVGIY